VSVHSYNSLPPFITFSSSFWAYPDDLSSLALPGSGDSKRHSSSGRGCASLGLQLCASMSRRRGPTGPSVARLVWNWLSSLMAHNEFLIVCENQCFPATCCICPKRSSRFEYGDRSSWRGFWHRHVTLGQVHQHLHLPMWGGQMLFYETCCQHCCDGRPLYHRPGPALSLFGFMNCSYIRFKYQICSTWRP